MKRKLLLLIAFALSVLLITACTKQEKEKIQPKFETGTYYPGMDWDDPYGNYTDPAVPDAKTARTVAQGILDGMRAGTTQEKYVLKKIFYDESNQIWVVSFGPQNNRNETGGYTNIAIQKPDGKIFKIWVSE